MLEFFNLTIPSCQKWSSKMKTTKPKKYTFPPLPPIFDGIPNKYGYKCHPFSKNLRGVFWFRQINQFWRFFDGQKYRQNWFICLNQKTPLRFFEIVRHLYPYLLGISSKIGGKGGKVYFFDPEIFIFDSHFWQEGIVELKNSFTRI